MPMLTIPSLVRYNQAGQESKVIIRYKEGSQVLGQLGLYENLSQIQNK